VSHREGYRGGYRSVNPLSRNSPDGPLRLRDPGRTSLPAHGPRGGSAEGAGLRGAGGRRHLARRRPAPGRARGSRRRRRLDVRVPATG
jgi:hypothetical protein